MSRLRGVCPPAAAHNALFSPHGRHGGRGAAEEAGGWQSQGGRRLRRDGGGEAGGSAVSEAAGRSGATAGLGCGTRLRDPPRTKPRRMRFAPRSRRAPCPPLRARLPLARRDHRYRGGAGRWQPAAGRGRGPTETPSRLPLKPRQLPVNL